MAGVCAGLGLSTDAAGHLYIAGPRHVAWANEANCRIAANNGARVDPNNGNLWVPPDARMIHKRVAGVTLVQTPHAAGLVELTHSILNMTAPACSDGQLMAVFSGGFLGQRMGSGNLWRVDRSITTSVDGHVIGFTGSETVAVAENNSGGVSGVAGAVDALTLYVQVPAGKPVRIDATWVHNRVSYSSAAANSYTWRPPAIEGYMFTLDQ